MKQYMAFILSVLTTLAFANDDVAEKIKPGLTRDAVVALIGSSPDEEGCKTYMGVSACKLIWSKGIVGRTRYEVEFIAGRVVTVQVMKAKGIL
jgi:hypothetical protein